jgi:hypothetical protein
MNSLRDTFFRLLLPGAALLLAACGNPSDPRAATVQFFQLIAANRTKEAYESAAFAFQAEKSLKAFETVVREQDLGSFASAQWEPPRVEGRLAKVRGEVKNASGRSRALVVTLNHESGKWRTYSIRTPRNVQTGTSANLFGSVGKTAAFTEAIDRPVPDDKTVRAMTLETLLRFNDAVQTRSFDVFYENVSKTWQKQLTIGMLTRAFQPFIDNEVDMSGIKDVEPVFDSPPMVTSEGLLLVAGNYPTDRYRVVFALRFIYELPKWKLFGIDVTLRK